MNYAIVSNNEHRSIWTWHRRVPIWNIFVYCSEQYRWWLCVTWSVRVQFKLIYSYHRNRNLRASPLSEEVQITIHVRNRLHSLGQELKNLCTYQLLLSPHHIRALSCNITSSMYGQSANAIKWKEFISITTMKWPASANRPVSRY